MGEGRTIRLCKWTGNADRGHQGPSATKGKLCKAAPEKKHPLATGLSMPPQICQLTLDMCWFHNVLSPLAKASKKPRISLVTDNLLVSWSTQKTEIRAKIRDDDRRSSEGDRMYGLDGYKKPIIYKNKMAEKGSLLPKVDV